MSLVTKTFMLGLCALVVACGSIAGEEEQCDGLTGTERWYRDVDVDGYGDPAEFLDRCTAPAGYVDNDLDCDDGDAAVNPDSEWHPDDDNDGYGDATTGVMTCVAPDGHTLDGSDCNDGSPDVNPTNLWFADSDGDGFGDPTVQRTQCEQPDDHVSNSDDCDDTEPAVNPNTAWYLDFDDDGFGDVDDFVVQCARPAGRVIDGGDCDDGNPILNPDTSWYLDADGDGYGTPTVSLMQCERPGGPPAYELADGDCDDDAINVIPGRGECPFNAFDATSYVSCLAISDDGASDGTGAYFIDPDGPGGVPAFAVFCDMTTDGGGWTALINPSTAGMPGPAIADFAYLGGLVGGSSSCETSADFIDINGWFGIRGYSCGNGTERVQLSWPNPINATDVMFIAQVQGYETHTITIDGVAFSHDAYDVPSLCRFWNGTGASFSPALNTCYATGLDVAPRIENGAFTGSLSIELTSGASGTDPNGNATGGWGAGSNIQKLFVR